jgi:hypothetical protein
MREPIVLNTGTATVSGYISYPSENTQLPFSITIGDNCCEEHAKIAAKKMAELYARSIVEKEQRWHPEFTAVVVVE